MEKIQICYKDINNVNREIFVECSITELDLSTRGIVSLDNFTFRNLPELKILWLNGNNISYLAEDTFNGLGKLEKLYLYYNKLKLLPSGIFRPLKNLKRIELSMNQIIKLDKEIFQSNTLLEKISLDFNQLFELPEDIFSMNSKITSIILSSNNLISLPSQLFSRLRELRFLSLSFNSLSSLPKHLLSSNICLEEIRLDNNPFKILDITSLQYAQKLQKIDILYCSGLEQIILDPVDENELENVPEARIDFSASPVIRPPPVIVARGLRAIVDFYSPEKTIFSSLTEIRLAFGVAGPEIKVDKCVLCKKPIYEKDRNVCKDCETFYDDNLAFGA